MASSLGSQPEGGRAFSRPLASTHDATNTPQRVHPTLYQGNLLRVVTDQPRYDSVADSYVASHPDAYDDEPDRTLLELAEPCADRDLLDFACGHGRIARELARRGATVVGVDISQSLLAVATATEATSPLGIEYVAADVCDRAALKGRMFDGVVSSFGLSDIDDLDGALTTVARVLRRDGFFVFSILHPCFPGNPPLVSASWPSGGGYFDEGWWVSDANLSTLRQKVGSTHRLLSTYFNALTRHHFVLERVAEPRAAEAWTRAAGLREPVPVYLVLRCRTSEQSLDAGRA